MSVIQEKDNTEVQAPDRNKSSSRPSDKPEGDTPETSKLARNTDRLLTSEPVEKVMSASRSLPLLICSIGNPGSTYANTLHSAGHTVVKRLAEHLGYSGFHKDKSYGNGLVSRPISPDADGDWTLWQSTSYMNESGKGVRAAYMAWSKTLADGEGKLVIIHDELEKPLGAVSLRTTQKASAKGHNGLKSIMATVGDTHFDRIGVGIGRPVSRASNDVARYVLKKMDPAEKVAIEGAVDQVITKLKSLRGG